MSTEKLKMKAMSQTQPSPVESSARDAKVGETVVIGCRPEWAKDDDRLWAAWTPDKTEIVRLKDGTTLYFREVPEILSAHLRQGVVVVYINKKYGMIVVPGDSKSAHPEKRISLFQLLGCTFGVLAVPDETQEATL